MTARVKSLVTATATLLVGVAIGPDPGTSASASTVIDRTFSCSATPDTARKIRVAAVSGFRDPEKRLRWKWLASAGVKSRFLNVVYLNAGTLPDARWRALGVSPDRCRASAQRMLLSRSGLAGGPASQLQDSDAYECVVSGFLVRIRAVFRTRVTLSVQARFGQRTLTTGAGVAAQEGQLVVRTQGGKPLAYADASETGKARLFTNPSCVAD